MAIFLPKNNGEDSLTGAPKQEWEAIEHASVSQKKSIIAFETYFTVLSEKLKDVSVAASGFEGRMAGVEGRADKIEKRSEDTHNLVVVGFVALLIVVVTAIGGFTFGYLQMVNDSIAKNDYKDNLSKAISNNESQIKAMKQCLIISGWLNPKCLEN